MLISTSAPGLARLEMDRAGLRLAGGGAPLGILDAGDLDPIRRLRLTVRLHEGSIVASTRSWRATGRASRILVRRGLRP
jgi:hypothetical protein